MNTVYLSQNIYLTKYSTTTLLFIYVKANIRPIDRPSPNTDAIVIQRITKVMAVMIIFCNNIRLFIHRLKYQMIHLSAIDRSFSSVNYDKVKRASPYLYSLCHNVQQLAKFNVLISQTGS